MEKRKPNPLVVVVAFVIHATIAVFTWRDIRRRTPTQIRGPKALWRTASVINSLGSAAYWLFARR